MSMSRINHKWYFEFGCISREELKAITKDFEKVLPFLETKFLSGIKGHKGIEKHQSWTCFRTDGEYLADTFFFGTHNISSGNDINMGGGLYNDSVMAFLSIAKKHIKHNIHIDTTVSDREWGRVLGLVAYILGYEYDLMDVTKNGKLRFKTWELNDA